MALNDSIRDLEIRHQVGIQRLASGILKKIITLLDTADADIVRQLAARGATLEGTFTSVRLKFLLDAIREINRDAYVEVGKVLRQELRDLAKYEVEFQTRLIQGQIAVALDLVTPSVELLQAITTSRPLGNKLLRELLAGITRGNIERIEGAIRLGMVQGETTSQIIARIRGTKAANFRNGIMEIGRVRARAMVQTAVNHVANAAREELYAANDDLIEEVQWVATLDTRTCPACGALDGDTFDMKKGPRPPLHVNCRCTTVPVVKSWRQLGIDADELPEGTRASMNGQVSGTETFATWLKRQSAAVQNETLGPTRAALFRRGGLSIERFTDARGNQLTLDALRRLESEAFDKAGLAA